MERFYMRRVFKWSTGMVERMLWLWVLAGLAGCHVAGPVVYPTPEAAVDGLVGAMRSDDPAALERVFGSEGREIVSSGDRVADRGQYERFVKAFEAKHALASDAQGMQMLTVGEEDWPFPVPLVRREAGWVFDAAAGREEILNRRVGKNELHAIQVCLAVVDAQHEYARRDADEDGLPNFAMRFVSSEGKRDGLYWPALAGEEASPLGELAAAAGRDGYRRGDGVYHGYRYKLLLGANAGREAMVGGKLLGGFGLVAWPAEYGNSGVMTFLVNEEGRVYQKDLGRRTAAVAGGMKRFEVDEGWEDAGG